MIQACLFQAGSFGNVVHGCAVETLLTKDLRGGFENIFSGQGGSLPNGRLLCYNIANDPRSQERVGYTSAGLKLLPLNMQEIGE